MHMISYQDCDPILSWEGLVEAIQLGHKRNKAEISDTFLYRKDDTLLSRSAWIDGIGIAIKCATIFPGNMIEKDTQHVNNKETTTWTKLELFGKSID